MALKLFCARRTRKKTKENGVGTHLRKNNEKGLKNTSVFSGSPILSVVNENCSPFVLHLLGGLNLTVRHISNLNYATDRGKPFLAIQCNLVLHFRFFISWRHILSIDLNSERKMGFLKDKAAVKAIYSSVKYRWSWKWPDECPELSFRKVGPIKYQITLHFFF